MAAAAEVESYYVLRLYAECTPMDFLPHALGRQGLIDPEEVINSTLVIAHGDFVRYTLPWLEVVVDREHVVAQFRELDRADDLIDLLLGLTQWGSGRVTAIDGITRVSFDRTGFFALQTRTPASQRLAALSEHPPGPAAPEGVSCIEYEFQEPIGKVVTATVRVEPSRRDGSWLYGRVQLSWEGKPRGKRHRKGDAAQSGATSAGTDGNPPNGGFELRDDDGVGTLDSRADAAVSLLVAVQRDWAKSIEWANAQLDPMVDLLSKPKSKRSKRRA
jgi:hypothetical protein